MPLLNKFRILPNGAEIITARRFGLIGLSDRTFRILSGLSQLGVLWGIVGKKSKEGKCPVALRRMSLVLVVFFGILSSLSHNRQREENKENEMANGNSGGNL